MEPPPASIDLARGDAYGRSFADVYDRWYAEVTDAGATARFVAERAGDRPVIELGVGSGRLATAMAEAGLPVVGLDASAAMLARCPRLDAVSLVRGDMRALPFRGPVGLVLIAFNTIFNLADAEDQASLLADLAAGFDERSSLVVETLDLSVLAQGPDFSLGLRTVDRDSVVVTATQLDRIEQIVAGQHLEIDHAGVTVRPWRLRWLSLNQLDELAQRVGLTLVERHRAWTTDSDEADHAGGSRPASDSGDSAISVYRIGTT